MEPYWKRFGKCLLRDSAPWARDNIFWAVFVLIAPIIAVLFLDRGHEIDWTVIRTTLWIYASVLVVYILIHIVRSAWKLDKELIEKCDFLEKEVIACTSLPPEVNADLGEILRTRSAGHGARFSCLEIFLRVSVHLQSPPVAEVSYDLDLTWFGGSKRGERKTDVEKSAVAKKKYLDHLGPLIMREIESGTDLSPLPTLLKNTQKCDGWLHFVFPEFPESLSRDADVMRLTISTPYGAKVFEKPLKAPESGASILALPNRNYVVMPSYNDPSSDS